MKVTINNFRTFGLNGKPAEFDIKPITILIGPNSSGKSSLLRAIDMHAKMLIDDRIDLVDADSPLAEIDGKYRYDTDKPLEIKLEGDYVFFSVSDYRSATISKPMSIPPYDISGQANFKFKLYIPKTDEVKDRSYTIDKSELESNVDETIDNAREILERGSPLIQFMALLKYGLNKNLVKTSTVFKQFVSSVHLKCDSIFLDCSCFLKVERQGELVKLDESILMYFKDDPNHEDVGYIEKIIFDMASSILGLEVDFRNFHEFEDIFSEKFVSHVNELKELIDFYRGDSGSISDDFNIYFNGYLSSSQKFNRSLIRASLYENRYSKGDIFLVGSPEYIVLAKYSEADKDTLIKFVNERLDLFDIQEKLHSIDKKEEGMTSYITIKLKKNDAILPFSAVGNGIVKLIWVMVSYFDHRATVPHDLSLETVFGRFRVDGAKYNLLHLFSEIEESFHPNLQSKLADLISARVSDSDRKDTKSVTNMISSLGYFTENDVQDSFVIETHSEYLVRRFQTLVAKGEIEPEDIIIYYFGSDPTAEDYINPIELNKNGFLTDDFGPGFMDEAANLITDLRRINRDGKN